jgi:hypothetical protein
MTRVFASTLRRFGLPPNAHIESTPETQAYTRLAKAALKSAEVERYRVAKEIMMKEKK